MIFVKNDKCYMEIKSEQFFVSKFDNNWKSNLTCA